jgi:cbb3-type cytochrome c oxidase subunit III
MRRIPIAMSGLGLFAILAAAMLAAGQDSKESVDHEISQPVVRGGIVFMVYCKLCHGERGDGAGRAAKLYPGLNLAIKNNVPDYFAKIIRGGGEATGRSAFMPPWRNELSEEQITDVIAYLQIVRDPVRRGEVAYKTNCILCHGIRADGKGRAASLLHPAPADLTHSNKTALYKATIIRLGGKAMGRSPTMPPWEERLTPTELQDLNDYLQTVLVVPHER